MRILNILKYLNITGVGTFSYTFLKCIKEKHPSIVIDVYFKTKIKDSILIRKFSEFCNVYFELPSNSYDIVYTHYDENDIPSTKHLYHFVHNLMSLDFMNYNADKVFCFGERAFGFINHSNKELIRNYIDLNRFKFKEPSKQLEKVLIFDSRNNAFLNSKLLATCSETNKYLSFLGEDLNNNIVNKWNVENYIKSTDLVIGVGRSVIESLACGKNVIIGNYNQFNNLITPDTFWIQAETNFSGWTKFRNDDFDIEYLINEFNKYNSEYGFYFRNQIETYFDIDKYVEKLI